MLHLHSGGCAHRTVAPYAPHRCAVRTGHASTASHIVRSDEPLFHWQPVLHRSYHTLLRRLPNHAPLSITFTSSIPRNHNKRQSKPMWIEVRLRAKLTTARTAPWFVLLSHTLARNLSSACNVIATLSICIPVNGTS